jgi:hypothetical protein
MGSRLALLLAAVCLSASGIGAQTPEPIKPAPIPLPSYLCRHVSTPVVIDGKLDDLAWREAVVFRAFTLPDGETRPAYTTEFRAVWDATTLYLAFVCEDPLIIANMTKRDSGLYDEDCVEAFLSTGGDLARYYEFEFSPRNTQMDASVFPDPNGRDKIVDYSWDCQGLTTATRIEAGPEGKQRWSIEIALPFASVGRGGQAPEPGESWRTNFYRIEYGVKPTQFICWSPTLDEGNFHNRDRFGHFVFGGETK